jgi:hypothetical protein
VRHAAGRSERAPGQPGEKAGGGQVRGWRARVGQLSYWFVLAGAAAALVIMRQGAHFLKSGTLVLAGFLLVAAIVRLTLPDRATGMLSSRRRSVDVAVFTTLGVGLLVAGLVVPVP